MARGRKARVDRPVRKVIYIPESLAAQVDLLLFDPLMGKTRYGELSKVATELLREWLDKQKALSANQVK